MEVERVFGIEHEERLVFGPGDYLFGLVFEVV